MLHCRSLLILLLFSFAFDPEAEEIQKLAGGLLWLVFAFAGYCYQPQLCPRSAQRCLGCAPGVSNFRNRAVFGKALANFVLLLALGLVCLPVFGVSIMSPGPGSSGS